MKYVLSYDRQSVRYTVSPVAQSNTYVQVFSTPFLHHVWPWIGNTLEPGDTLEWVND